MLMSHGTRSHLAERLRRLFGGMPCRTQAAALPWRRVDGGLHVMLVTSRDTGRWVLPKGWPERREALFEAAAREAAEEAGISGAIAREEFGSFYYGKELRSGMRWRCEVRVFPMLVEQEAERWPERKKRKRRWFPAAEAARRVREKDLAELIIDFAEIVPKIAA